MVLAGRCANTLPAHELARLSRAPSGAALDLLYPSPSQVARHVPGSFEGGTITTHMGAQLGTEKISPTDRFDLVYVPGGIGAGAASLDDTIVDFVKAHRAEGRWVGANCAGLAVLYRAGVIDGYEVTGPATVARRLTALGVDVASPRRSWMIDPDRRVFTVAGAASVYPSTMASCGTCSVKRRHALRRRAGSSGSYCLNIRLRVPQHFWGTAMMRILRKLPGTA